MKIAEYEKLTPNQITAISVGSMLGIGVLSLPRDVVEISGVDGWISAPLGAIYPLYMVLICVLLSKKVPNNTIFYASNLVFGNFLGSFLNLIFTGHFLFQLTALISGLSYVLSVYVNYFLTSFQYIIIVLLVALLSSIKGLKSLGKINEFILYFALVLILVPIGGLKQGSILNVMPVFSSGIKNIALGSKATIFAYGGIEVIFLIYPYIDDLKKLKSAALKSIGIICFPYTWFTFITIYYLGIDIIPKFLWPIVTVTECIQMPVINNFRLIFMFLWSSVMFKTISNNYYFIGYSLQYILKSINFKVNINKIFILLLPIFLYLGLMYKDVLTRADIMDNISLKILLFNIFYVTLTTILIYLKKDVKNE